MLGIYPIIKLVAPTGIVAVLNLFTYLSFQINTKIQTNNRNWRIQKHFRTVKKEIFDNIIGERDTLINSRYGTIEAFFKNEKNKDFLKQYGGTSLINAWDKIAPKSGEAILQDQEKKNDFFQEVRVFCISKKDAEDKKLLVEISKLCSKKTVQEKDFDLPD
ncbi:hypothetical protein A6V39_04080 [Candidatus Mycoplasma haematobovis]|uniref:Uncharacterized protein n=1 Tax=Candidatus Mycoplasma haematobovis TaxID=432608 RepID=A0A1A9QC73_9MOLU|nr:hypothetical protein [Candidatus Mycoplasma haematobovis]OAL10067.1 hypothetical protein A6V39_04080 [Candidatus Mycoplasma haematobovis]